MTDKVSGSAKNAAKMPGQIASGTGHLLKDPTFWKVTAGAAALGAAGVGTYFLLKNADRGGSAAYPYDYPYGGLPGSVAPGYPYAGYSQYSSTYFPGEHMVTGFRRSNGTYVPSYRRTNADGTMFNNYSSRGNINPHTLRQGWIVPRY